MNYTHTSNICQTRAYDHTQDLPRYNSINVSGGGTLNCSWRCGIAETHKSKKMKKIYPIISTVVPPQCIIPTFNCYAALVDTLVSYHYLVQMTSWPAPTLLNKQQVKVTNGDLIILKRQVTTMISHILSPSACHT